MKKKLSLYLIGLPQKILLTSILLSSCSSTTQSKSSQLKLSQDIFVSQNSAPGVLHKKGEVISLDDTPIFLEAPGYISMLLVPLKKPAGEFAPVLRKISEWSGDELEKTLNAKLGEIVAETTRIQFLLSLKKESEALAKIEQLQAKYPKISYLNMLRASAFFMMGETEKSKFALEDALRDFPDDENARKFYESLGGKLFTPPSRGTASKDSAEIAPEKDVKTKSKKRKGNL